MFNSENNKSICAALWTHVMIKPDGRVKPCCRFRAYDEEYKDEFQKLYMNNFESSKQVFENKMYDKIRQMMLEGKPISGCEKCYWEEKTAGDSMRMEFNKNYNNAINNATDYKLKFLEATFGNYCNLSCRTCNGGLSTHWHSDEEKLQKILDFRDKGNTEKVNVEFVWSPEDFKETDKIKFTGGEPMLHPDFIKFLDTVIQGGNAAEIELEIFTNASWVPKEKVISRLRQFKKIEICMSVDGYKQENDYIRNNSDWHTTDQSIKEWLKYESEIEGVNVILAPTLSVYNIFSVLELFKYFGQLKTKKGLPLNQSNTLLTYAMYPEYTNLKVLPGKKEILEKLKQEGSQFIKDTKNYNDTTIARVSFFYKKIMSILLNDIEKFENFDKFWKYTMTLDKIRNQNFKESFPDLYNHILKYQPEIRKDYE